MEPPKLQQQQVNSYGYAQANLLVNPGFELWQRGAGPFTATNAFCADEWRATSVSGGESQQVDRESTIKKYSDYSLKFNVSSSASTSGISQGIENFKNLAGQWITYSLWVNTVSPSVRIRITDYNGTEQPVSSDYHSGSGEWEQLTVTKQLRTGLLPFASWEHSFGVRLSCYLDSTVNGTFYMDGGTCVLGNFPQGVPFIPLNPAEDMQRCERFYEVQRLQDCNVPMFTSAATLFFAANMRHRTAMYAVPTASTTLTQVDLYQDPAVGAANTPGDVGNWTPNSFAAQDVVRLSASRSGPLANRSVAYVSAGLNLEVT